MSEQAEFDEAFHRIMMMESAAEIDDLITRVADIEADIRAAARGELPDADISEMMNRAMAEIASVPPEALISAVLCAVDLANAVRDQLDHIVNVLGNVRDVMAKAGGVMEEDGYRWEVSEAMKAAVGMVDLVIRRREGP